MSRKEIFAIGDIHGCHTELEMLLRKLPLTADSLVVFLGDYIDRGPRSRQVVDTILQLRQRTNVVTLRGNHEAMLDDFLDHPESAGAGHFILNGGGSTLASYQTEPGRWEMPESHRRFFKELVPCFATEEYFFVHAGVPNLPLAQLDLGEHAMQMLWIRSTFLESRFSWEKTIVHGHTPVREVEFHSNRINVDTGCVFDGYLSAVELPAKRVYSVEKQQKSQPPVYLRDVASSSRMAARFRGAFSVVVEKNGQKIEFETLNYNEVGLLIREPVRGISLFVPNQPRLYVDEVINGRIGRGKLDDILFSGVVVRVEPRNEGILYGVRLDRLVVPGDRG